MSRRFHDLLLRYAYVRRSIDAESRLPVPSLLRLARLRALELKIRRTLHAFIKKCAVRRASRPHFVVSLAR